MGSKTNLAKKRIDTSKRLLNLLEVLKAREQTAEMVLRIEDVQKRLKELDE